MVWLFAGGNVGAQSLPYELIAATAAAQKNTPQPSNEQAGLQQYPSPPDQQGYFSQPVEDTPRATHYNAPSVPGNIVSMNTLIHIKYTIES